MTKKELLARAKTLPVTLQAGKNGISAAFIAELRLLARKKGMVKVRFLKSSRGEEDMRTTAARTATAASLLVVSVVGNTAVFAKPEKQQPL